jgi:hypothetical protein
VSVTELDAICSVTAEGQWVDLVESHVDPLWRFAIAEGLSEAEATTACELAWLRLAQRWSPIGAPADDVVTGWLQDTVRQEARAARRRAVAPVFSLTRSR